MLYLEDIENLTLSGNSVIKDNFTQEDYLKSIKTNVLLLELLLGYVQFKASYLSLSLQSKVLVHAKSLLRVLEGIKSITVTDFSKSPLYIENGSGYLKEHPESNVIEYEYMRMVKHYEHLLSFMRFTYLSGKIESQNDFDHEIINEIVAMTKKVCEELGIHSESPEFIYESFANINGSFDFHEDINEKNENTRDVMFTNLPYNVTCVTFTEDGAHNYELPLNSGIILYNRDYYDGIIKGTIK